MIKIIVDSTAYIPKEFIEENDIQVVPLHVLYMDKEFEEGLPGSYDEFFASFTKTKIFPKHLSHRQTFLQMLTTKLLMKAMKLLFSLFHHRFQEHFQLQILQKLIAKTLKKSQL